MTQSPKPNAGLRGLRVLLGVTGGIAAYKAALIVRELRQAGVEVTVAMTESATRFIAPLTLSTLSGRPVVTSLWEPVHHPDLPSDVEHIGLVKWAHVAIMAPATMNSLGKLAQGLADDSVSTFFAAYPPERVLLAPAMNGGMWRNEATQSNLDRLRERGCSVVGPGHGELACGDWDEGRMAEPGEILAALAELADCPQGSLAGKRVLISAGPTREAIDPVRFLSNPSTGTMGLALARAAWEAGADTTLVAGPGVAVAPPGVRRLDVESAGDMAAAMLGEAEHCDLLFMAAAVADWRLSEASESKLKKGEATLSLELEATQDILAELGRRDLGGFRVGFALETEDLEKGARGKLERKQLQMIVANRPGPDSGFGTETNEVLVLAPAGWRQELPLMDKMDLGRRLLHLAAQRAFGSEES